MPKFRKKPVVVEAIQWDGTYKGILRITKEFIGINTFLSHPYNTEEKIVANGQEWGWVIGTLEGSHVVTMGDFVVKGIKGEFYPCKPDIFALTYDALEDI